jgi:hypothetical protein
MEHEESVSFPLWQREYDAVLQETDDASLFKRIEVAEATMLVRLDAIKESAAHRAESGALTDGLAHLALLKSQRLGFQK